MTSPGHDIPFRHGMEITRYVYVPVRDGARLAADIYRPKAPGKYPCLLVQTPYNKNNFGADGAARYVAAGYVLCVADVRGTGGSEGEPAAPTTPSRRSSPGPTTGPTWSSGWPRRISPTARWAPSAARPWG